MKQQFGDLLLVARTDRRVWAAGAFLVVALFVWALTSSPDYRTAPGLMDPQKASPQGMGSEEAFKDLIIAFKNDIERGNKERSELGMVVRRYGTEFKEHRQQVTGIFETLADKFEQLAREVDALAEAIGNRQEQVSLEEDIEDDEPDDVERIGFVAPPADPPPPEPKALQIAVISPGDSVPVKLLTGVNAPVDGTPYPVVFQLNGPVTGPDGASLDVGEARLIAAAQGSEADGRALFRLTNLAMRHNDGRRSVIDVDGWVVGEDGVRGMKGLLIDKLGRLIAATAGVSFVAALGEQAEDSRTYLSDDENDGGVNIDSDDFEIAGTSALFEASNRLGEIMLSRYESLVPVVEVLSGREVVAIFSKTSEVEIIQDGDWQDGALYAASYLD